MKPIAIITGAGASMPYGFPSGAELRDAILRYWRPPQLMNHMPSLGGNPLHKYSNGQAELLQHPGFDGFRQQLQRQELASVDRFLEQPRNKQYVEVGLVATAMAIGACHHTSHHLMQLPSSRWNSHWYRGFVDLLDNGQRLDECRIKIITFNYDVSLETYLCQVLSSRWDMRFEDVWGQLESSLGFLHVYGDVSSPWADEDAVAYEKDPQAWADTAAKRLKIVAQGRDDDHTFQRAQEWLTEAEAVFFYGFGYDETNMRRLGVLTTTPCLEGKTVMGTCKGVPSPHDHIQKLSHAADTFWSAVLEQCQG
ncbi:MAG: hypothetical protein WD468_13015 [Pirellulales bacterium]